MKKSKVIIVIALAVVVALAIVIVEEIRINRLELEIKEVYVKLTIRVLDSLRSELEEITTAYEQGDLSDERLSEHYDKISHYAMTIHNISPDEFFTDINAVNIIEKFDTSVFNDNIYNQYIKIIGYLDYTHYVIEENHTDTEWLDYYERFTDDEFNSQFKILIDGLFPEEVVVED